MNYKTPIKATDIPEVKEFLSGMTILPEGEFQGINCSDEEIKILATYNSEIARGILHRPDWMREMFELQERFNKTQRL